MTTSTTDKVMIALEEASQSVPTKQEGWAKLEQVKAFESTASVIKLTDLVKVGRAERSKKNGKLYWKPVRGGGYGFFADPTNPEDPYRSPDSYDNPRGKEPGKTRPDGEWNNWGKPNENNPTGVRYTASGAGVGKRRGKGKHSKSGRHVKPTTTTAEDILSLSGASMGAAAASGAVGGAVGGAASGAVRATVTNMM